MLLSLHDADPLPGLLEQRGLPVVLGGRPARMLTPGTHGMPGTPGAGVAFVDADNEGGARLAVGHLLDRNRRRIAAIAGPQDMAVGVARLRGYRAAMRAIQNGSPVSDRLVAYGDFSEASGAAAMERLLHLTPDLDAVFAASDPMAAGALRVLHAHGRRVPADVAVVGFDDSAVARQTQPPLTTVHQAVEGMGREMVRLLLARIGGGPAHSTVLDTHLVVREST
jgi:DNA-binding LacI/PurR family transcriptional regulator